MLSKTIASSCHKEALQVIVVIPSSCPDVGTMLSRQYADEIRNNRKCFLKVMAAAQYLARQGIALRGDGDDSDSNFIQLLKMQADDNQKLASWLSQKTNKYTSHESQNEILKVMALNVLRKVASSIFDASFYTIMCDECTDSSNREQVVLCIRWINDELEPHEDFIGLYKVDNILANTIVSVIKDSLIRMNLSLSKCRGQCYDGASVMTGVRNGVAKQISNEESRAVFSHCYGHALNLAVGDTIKQIKVLKDVFDVIYEVTKLIKYSPKRDAVFEKLKEAVSPDNAGFRVLCPTRWTVRAASLQSVIDNYTALQELWAVSQDDVTDPSVKARIIGVEHQFKTFQFFFGVFLGNLLLKHSDNLSKTLQSPKISASEGQQKRFNDNHNTTVIEK